MSDVVEKIYSMSFSLTECSSLANFQQILGGDSRRTSTISLSSANHTGVGEDVSFDAADHIGLEDICRKIPLNRTFSVGEFSSLLHELDLFKDQPSDSESLNCRRWAFESAVIDLALKTNKTTLAEIMGVDWSPPNYLVSMRMSHNEDIDRIKEIQKVRPTQKFKVDAMKEWDDDFIEKLANLNCVEILDMKGLYFGTPLHMEADAEFYNRIFQAFEHALLEDALATESTQQLLHRNQHRLAWDAPIESDKDLQRMSFPGTAVNLKPSRCGSLKSFVELATKCQESGRTVYIGGQYEVAIGRLQNQYLAGLICPDSTNDIAPKIFNSNDLESIPTGELAYQFKDSGFANLL